MYSIVIVDDERNICEGIVVTLQSACPEVEIQGVFHTGEDLLDFLAKNCVDILICDIKMGEISGLDIAKYIDESQMDIHIILITGHRRFEYAHQAIQHKVDYFLTKPYSSKELVDTIKEIEKSLDSKREHIRNTQKLRDYEWDVARKNVKELYSGTWDYHRPLFGDCLSFPIKNSSALEIKYHLCSDSTDVQEISDEDLAILMTIGEKHTTDTLCFYCDSSEQELVFVCFSIAAFDSFITDSFISEVANELGLTFNSVVRTYATFDDYYWFCKSRKCFDDLSSLLASNHRQTWDSLLTLSLDALSAKQLDSLCNYVAQVFGEFLPSMETDKREGLRNILMHVNSGLSKSDVLINNVITFISQNYMDSNLCRDSIVAKFNVHPDYLSRVFKSSTGERLSEYILRIRVEQAKTLLAHSTKSTAEIALAVGYQDTSYFKKSFKKYTGIAPSNYRNLKKENE